MNSPVITIQSAMLVDDDVFTLALYEDILQQLGVGKILRAESTAQAMAILAHETPDVILCDLHMPGGRDGFQLMEDLAQHQYTGGVVLISGQKNHVIHSANIMANFHSLNVWAALEKPVSLAALAQVLAKGKP